MYTLTSTSYNIDQSSNKLRYLMISYVRYSNVYDVHMSNVKHYVDNMYMTCMCRYTYYMIPYGNQTWQWKMHHL